jgi:hypothetical protein
VFAAPADDAPGWLVEGGESVVGGWAFVSGVVVGDENTKQFWCHAPDAHAVEAFPGFSAKKGDFGPV